MLIIHRAKNRLQVYKNGSHNFFLRSLNGSLLKTIGCCADPHTMTSDTSDLRKKVNKNFYFFR